MQQDTYGLKHEDQQSKNVLDIAKLWCYEGCHCMHGNACVQEGGGDRRALAFWSFPVIEQSQIHSPNTSFPSAPPCAGMAPRRSFDCRTLRNYLDPIRHEGASLQAERRQAVAVRLSDSVRIRVLVVPNVTAERRLHRAPSRRRTLVLLPLE